MKYFIDSVGNNKFSFKIDDDNSLIFMGVIESDQKILLDYQNLIKLRDWCNEELNKETFKKSFCFEYHSEDKETQYQIFSTENLKTGNKTYDIELRERDDEGFFETDEENSEYEMISTSPQMAFMSFLRRYGAWRDIEQFEKICKNSKYLFQNNGTRFY